MPTVGAGSKVAISTDVDETKKVLLTFITSMCAGMLLPVVMATLMVTANVPSDVLHDSLPMGRSRRDRPSLGHNVGTIDKTLLVLLRAMTGFPRLSAQIAKFCAARASAFRD